MTETNLAAQAALDDLLTAHPDQKAVSPELLAVILSLAVELLKTWRECRHLHDHPGPVARVSASIQRGRLERQARQKLRAARLPEALSHDLVAAVWRQVDSNDDRLPLMVAELDPQV